MFSHGRVGTGLQLSIRWLLVWGLVLAGMQQALADPPGALERERMLVAFPALTSISEPAGEFAVRTLKAGEDVLGYAFQSKSVIDLPAYSGKPINMQVVLDPQGDHPGCLCA